MKFIRSLSKVNKVFLATFLISGLFLFPKVSAQLNDASNSASLVQEATPSATTVDDVLVSKNLPFSTKIDQTKRFFEDELVLVFKDNTPLETQRKILQENNLVVTADSKIMKDKLIRVDSAKREQILAALKTNPNVEYVGLNYVVRANESSGSQVSCYPNDPYYCTQIQKGLSQIRAPEGWTLNKGSSSVVVAVLDSGIDYNHYDLGLSAPTPGSNGGRVIRGRNVTQPNGYFNDSIDTVGHGTQVAGIIGALTNNYQAIAGVDWFAKLVSIKFALGVAGTNEIVSNGFLLTQAILAAVRGETLAHFPDYTAYDVSPAKVINISYGLLDDDPQVKGAIDEALAKGVTVVAAVDNSLAGVTDCFMQFPAAYPGVVSVAAVDDNNQHATGCTGNVNSGITYQKLQVVAPGKNISTLDKGSGITANTGTSFAAPFVSGVASILTACRLDGFVPGTVPVTYSIVLGAKDLGSPGWDSTYGYGLVDLWNSYRNDECSLNDSRGIAGSVLMIGDVDCNGTTNLADAAKILRYIAGLEAGGNTCSTGVFLPMADVDKNGQINELDALYIRQYVDNLRDIQTMNLVSPAQDSDNDGLTNSQESAYSCLNPQVNDGQSDPDNDSLSVGTVNIRLNNIVEITMGTNPCQSDSDGDQFKDGGESYIGTDPTDNCSNNSTHAAFPPDFNNDKAVNIIDIGAIRPHFNSQVGQANYNPRFDLNADGKINIIDIGAIRPYFGNTCS